MTRSEVAWDAVVLAGGRGSRLGGVDKGTLLLDGGTLLDRLEPALRAAGRVVVVGGPSERLPAGAVWVREDPAFGGPVAGAAAGLAALDAGGAAAAASGRAEAEAVALLAVDMPHAAEGLHLLIAAWAEDADGVVAVDSSGRRQPLLALYRAEGLRAALDQLRRDRGRVEGSSMRQLLSPLRLREVTVPDRITADVDTPEDAERLGITVPGAAAGAARQEGTSG